MTDRIPAQSETDRLIGVPDLAKWLGVSEDWVRAHAGGRRAPALPVVRVNRGTMRFRVEAINEWIKRYEVAA